MFVRYLKVFVEHHKNYFTRLSIKAKLNIGIINEDIMIKQLNSNGVVEEKTNKRNLSDEESILKYVGSTDTNNVLKGELNKIISNINSDEETNISPRSTKSDNSTISSTESDYSNDITKTPCSSPVINNKELSENIILDSASNPPLRQESHPDLKSNSLSQPEPEPEHQPEPNLNQNRNQNLNLNQSQNQNLSLNQNQNQNQNLSLNQNQNRNQNRNRTRT